MRLSVNPVYYVSFTTATLCASFILFGGFNTTSAVNTISLLAGFLVIFTGVYLLNLSRGDPDGRKLLSQTGRHSLDDGIGTDMISSIQTRRSMQARRSTGSATYGRVGSGGWDEEEGLGLDDLAEESEDDAPLNGKPRRNGSLNGGMNGGVNGKARANGVRQLNLSTESSRRASGLRSPGARSPGLSRSPSGGRSPRSPRPL